MHSETMDVHRVKRQYHVTLGLTLWIPPFKRSPRKHDELRWIFGTLELKVFFEEKSNYNSMPATTSTTAIESISDLSFRARMSLPT
jgi:hypothetical protein